ncbi:MAG: hypothetical protein LBP27_06965 [Treponema sp.]|jgi:hypothetical protein|nr:hypothetical protein [Treponema sp.]
MVDRTARKRYKWKKYWQTGNIMHKYAIRLQSMLRRADGKPVAGVACGVGIHRATVRAFRTASS